MDLNPQDYFGFELDFLCFFQIGRAGNFVGLLDLPQSGPCFPRKMWPDLGVLGCSSTPLAPELREWDALGPPGRSVLLDICWKVGYWGTFWGSWGHRLQSKPLMHNVKQIYDPCSHVLGAAGNTLLPHIPRQTSYFENFQLTEKLKWKYNEYPLSRSTNCSHFAPFALSMYLYIFFLNHWKLHRS